MRFVFDGFILAVQFFTPIPLSVEVPWEERKARFAVMWLPFIGLSIGMLLAGAFLALQAGSFSSLAVSIVLLFLMTVTTGGLHLDGWMDCADAYFSFQDRRKRLEVMSDPRTGAFGVIALLFLLLFRWLFLYEAVHLQADLVPFVLIVLPFIVRIGMVYTICFTSSAKESGLAHHFQRYLKRRDFVIVLCLGIMLLSLGLFIFNGEYLYLMLSAGIMLYTALFQIFVKRSFGGITGDTLGAFIEGGETFLWMGVWLLLSYGMV
ncbi:adenosylcobinamide-GDP ribazoletransferase [Bacillus tianshenii]|nr:adenosylcobinamide-GDP ribazoletransferase [Bacillus tianshenii]